MKRGGVALVEMWTGRDARLLRQALRLSVRGFAERLGLPPRTISKWEALGVARTPRPDYQAILDTVLRLATEEQRARFSESLPAAVASPAPARTGTLTAIGSTWDQGSTQILTDFLFSEGALTAESSTRLAHEWRVLEPPQVIELRAGRRVGVQLSQVVRERVEILRRMDDFIGGGDLHELVRTELRATIDLVREASYTEATGRALLAAVAEMCQLAGWVTSDAGLHALAERFYLGGVTAAHAAQVPDTAANLLSCLSYQLANIGRPQQAAVLATSAVNSLDKAASSSARTLLLERVAWATARLGDAQTTERTLAEVEQIFTGPTPGEDPPWTYWLNQSEIDLMTGRCATELKRPAWAIPLLVRAVSQYDESHARELSLYLSWLAEAHIYAGDIDEAAGVASRALQLMAGLNSVRSHARIRVIQNLLKPYRAQAAVTELDQQIRAELR